MECNRRRDAALLAGPLPVCRKLCLITRAGSMSQRDLDNGNVLAWHQPEILHLLSIMHACPFVLMCVHRWLAVVMV